MAKLSANRELARFQRSLPIEDPTDAHLLDSRKAVYAFMSDGAILSKYVVKFRDCARQHDYGWKKAAKVPLAQFPVLQQRLLQRGYERI